MSLNDFGLLLVRTNGTHERILPRGTSCERMCARAFGIDAPFNSMVQEGFPFVFYYLLDQQPVPYPNMIGSFVHKLVRSVFDIDAAPVENSVLHTAPALLIGRRLVTKATSDLQLVMPAAELRVLEGVMDQLVSEQKKHQEDLERLKRVYKVETLVIDFEEEQGPLLDPFETLFELEEEKKEEKSKKKKKTEEQAKEEEHSDTADWPMDDIVSEDLSPEDPDLRIVHKKKPVPPKQPSIPEEKQTKAPVPVQTAHARCTYEGTGGFKCTARAVYRTKGFFCKAHCCPECPGPHKMMNKRKDCYECMRKKQGSVTIKTNQGSVTIKTDSVQAEKAVASGIGLCVYKDRMGNSCENKAAFRARLVSFCREHRCKTCKDKCHKATNGYSKCSECLHNGSRGGQRSTMVLENLEEPKPKTKKRLLTKRKLRSADVEEEPDRKRYKY